MPTLISNDLAEVIERLQGQEALDWEVKAANGGIPNSIWETVSAFANTHGGWLILGIAERGEDITVEGVGSADQMVRRLHDQIRNSSKISYPVCGAADVHVADIDDKKIIGIRIPPAARRVRPV